MRKKGKAKQSQKQLSAQEFTNVKDIRGEFLYTRDGFVFCYLKIFPISMDLLSRRERKNFTKSLTAEISSEKEPLKFLAVSRPTDITPLLDQYQELLSKTENTVQRDLLRKETKEISRLTYYNEEVERQFYFCLYEKYEENRDKDLQKRIEEFQAKFEINEVKTKILEEAEIIQLCNLVNNPAVVLLEDEDVEPALPLLQEVR
ncbi:MULTISPECIES: hypothetical protein [Anaerostipes]|uniref:hypothetical protein n=1 Tax=Anaerostipes TaxID=207244 RepID=UPI0011C19719|nr:MULTISPECIES: hypothetical protein [Anaerostipes]